MEIKVIGQATDLRTQTPVIYAQMPVQDYLELVSDDFDDFRFQRKRVNYTPYTRMKEDIKKGALLPPITLAIKSEYSSEIVRVIDNSSYLEDAIRRMTGKLNILDGLQRTYILQDIKNEGHIFDYNQKLLLEFWVESEIKHLIYRLIVLNAGQKKMSMRHQIELLFLNIKETIECQIPDLIIHTQKESTRRNQPKKYPLDKIVMGYQSFLLKTPEVKRSNLVAQEMLENNVLDSTADELGKGFDDFIEFLKIYAELDQVAFQHYSKYPKFDRDLDEDAKDESPNLENSKHWFAEENVMNCFFASVSKYISILERVDLAKDALRKLIYKTDSSEILSDPLGLDTLYKLQYGMNPRKVSVEFQTRKMLFLGFQEYLSGQGEINLTDCWTLGAL